MRAYERLLRYVTIHTASDEGSSSTPSTARQFELARLLAEEMRQLGLENVELDDHCYVYGTLPATPGFESAPAVGFIAHMDTSPEFAGENVRPRLIENYDGKDIPLGDSGRVIPVSLLPYLPDLAGRTLIVTDGTTLLGADDKAGIAEIMTMAEEIRETGMPHGEICFCFTPDEEVGRGTEHFDLERFGAYCAYPVDGGPEGEVVSENFNACGADVYFTGVNMHPGASKDVMVNAALVAMEFNAMLPAGDTPRHTRDREGFFHLTAMEGGVESASLRYIVRDHDAAAFSLRKAMLEHAAALLNEKYGPDTVRLTLREQYRNMAEKIEPEYHSVVEKAIRATRSAGLEPRTDPIRGGTDGAMLSWRGLPCPNLGTGGYAFHGPYEHISVEGMDKAVQVLINIVKEWTKY